jgi:hypothetical protein
MEKTIGVALNNFLTTPHTLRVAPNANDARDEMTVNLAHLFHQYFVDSYGIIPPDPDPAHFEYLQFLLPSPDFRFQGDGIGAPTHKCRNCSQELGHAFCRWFLHEHLNITYFAHMSDVLNKVLGKSFGGLRIERSGSGDAPDYFCAESVDKVFLAEAKGRFGSIAFNNREFDEWRDQFSHVVLKNSSGEDRSIKGFIVATRFGTEVQPNLKSTLFAEDPQSPGSETLNNEDRRAVGSLIVSTHYSYVAQKMNQQILSASLMNGFIVAPEILFPGTIWEFNFPYIPLQGRRFVGGYYSRTGMPLPIREINGRVVLNYSDPFRLDYGGGTFYGVEERIFEQVVAMARRGHLAAVEIELFEYTEPFYSAISTLRDGSIISPIEFLRPIQERVF